MTKKNIKIKVNTHLGKLTTRSKDVAAEALTAIRLYKTESSVLCGKTYEYRYSYTVINPQWKRQCWK
jgi:hypothetical protein